MICMQSIKEHNLKANHNGVGRFVVYKVSVCNLSKNTIWKQITTVRQTLSWATNLYAIYQRTQSESKSQQARCYSDGRNFCMQSIKEHNLKANHNTSVAHDLKIGSVCNLSKNTIWKQITTKSFCAPTPVCLYAIYQRTQSESKSQPKHRSNRVYKSVCNLSKNTIWKQITTPSNIGSTGGILYAIYQRTQSESKSQPICCACSRSIICMQSIKEHNLKANHNVRGEYYRFIFLYAIYQRTQSESKSQLSQ